MKDILLRLEDRITKLENFINSINFKDHMDYEKEVQRLLKNTTDIHLVGGLAAETGEVCSIFQKFSYKNIPLDLNHLREELGDVYFYTTAIANKYGFKMEEVLKSNITKLKRRHNE